MVLSATAGATHLLLEARPLKLWENHFRETSQSSTERRDKQLSDRQRRRFGAGMGGGGRGNVKA